MKRILLISLAVIFSSTIFAQKIEVREVTGKFRNGNQNALSTFVYHSDIKTVRKEFESLLKSYKGKVSTKKGETFGDDLLIASVSNNTLDVYAYCVDTKDGAIELVAGFDLGGAYLSSSLHQEQYARVAQIMREFALKATEKAYAEYIKGESKDLKSAKKSHEKMIKEKTNLEKQNQDFKKKIEQNEKSIEKMSKKIEDDAAKLKEMESEFDKLKKAESKIK